MDKRFILIFSIFFIFISLSSVCTSDPSMKYRDLNWISDGLEEEDLSGCCSIAYQMEGNNSTIAFRRDANLSAEIFVEQIDWHGKPAIKQYKTDGGYFCQVIVTSDGWTIGYGGRDDGEDNQIIENITAGMVLNNSIDNASLERIEDIKHPYGRGHVLIKAPDGRYGVAMANSHFSGHLDPGEYISIPNKPEYIRSGELPLNSSDHVGAMHELETTDAYGVVRRDITVFDFQQISNETFNGNITNITLSNDDGSVYHIRATGHETDDVHYNGRIFEGSSIPIAPKYQSLATVEYPGPQKDSPSGMLFNVVFYLVLVLIFVILFGVIIRTVHKVRHARKRRRHNRNR